MSWLSEHLLVNRRDEDIQARLINKELGNLIHPHFFSQLCHGFLLAFASYLIFHLLSTVNTLTTSSAEGHSSPDDVPMSWSTWMYWGHLIQTWVRFPSSQLWHSKSLTRSAVTLPVAPCTRGLLPIKQKGFTNLATKHTLQVYTHIFTFSQGIKKNLPKEKYRNQHLLLHTLLSVRHFPGKEQNQTPPFLPFLFTNPIFTENTGSLSTLVENKCVYLTKTDTRNAIQNHQPTTRIKIQPLCLKSIRASRMSFYRHKRHRMGQWTMPGTGRQDWAQKPEILSLTWSVTSDKQLHPLSVSPYLALVSR